MGKIVFAAVLAAVSGAAFGLGADVAGVTNAVVRGTCVGDVAVVSAKPGDWRFSAVRREIAPGCDVVTVTLANAKPARPPAFHLLFTFPGAGVRHAWYTDSDKESCHLRPWAWWGGIKGSSQLAREMPLVAALDGRDNSLLTAACSDPFNKVDFGIFAYERTCMIGGRFDFLSEAPLPVDRYEVSLLVDRRRRFWGDAVRDAADWIAAAAGCRPAHVPEAAFDPLYSSWYAYWQDVHAADLEREAKLAAALGMKTMILDDGWQKDKSRTFYSATGDWMPVASRFPDMKAHVAAVHAAGLKYMLWLAVPFVGDESRAWARFKGKFLCGAEGSSTATLDPRFPEVREYLISTYERVVGEWGFDGVKLDFIDAFVTPSPDPAEKENYAGRDIKSVPVAVDTLMKDVVSRLRGINPDVLIEFRQHYHGPAIRQYGNMIRATDCPADHQANRRRIADLRLTSGPMAVHSDMLVWNRGETAAGAAFPILNAIFGTVQYSMVLAGLPDEHRAVISHWLDFSQRHRKTLLKSAFRPHHPELGYTWIEAESAEERIAAVYSEGQAVPAAGGGVKREYLLNASPAPRLAVEFASPRRVEVRDAAGRRTGETQVTAGLRFLAVPECGYAVVYE